MTYTSSHFDSIRQILRCAQKDGKVYKDKLRPQEGRYDGFSPSPANFVGILSPEWGEEKSWMDEKE